MADLWYQCVSWLCTRVYFSRVEVLPAAPRLNGATLLVALHRNGAVDGWVYKSIFPNATFLIAAQLREKLLARLFFNGITVIRDKDTEQEAADRAANAASMRLCHELLARGGVLAIFPEGTSSLGPRHLPFKSGAARLAADAFQRQVPLTVVPLGISYDAPSTFRSNVQVIVGQPLVPSSDSLPVTVPEIKQVLASRLSAST
jgi:1-acyl-sn-glycerol-3-phosphate acyltransferase